MKYIFTFLLFVSFFANAQDTTPPVVSNFWTQDTVLIGVFSDFESQIPDFSITDDVDGDITNQAVVANEVNEDSLGYYDFTISAKDLAQNSVSQSVVIHVVDTTSPKVTLNGPKWEFVLFGNEYTDFGVTVSDNYYPAENLTIIIGSNFKNTKTQGRFCVTYTADDLSGNQSETVFRVICIALDSIDCATLPGEICQGARTGLSENSTAGLNIYPNPSKGHFSINKAVDLIEVYDTKGQLILTTNAQEFELKESGIYLLKANTSKGRTFTQKLIVE
ncbi:MAG: immunoglobulin-like domain-containing protein [Bacteroidia bacterium]